MSQEEGEEESLLNKEPPQSEFTRNRIFLLISLCITAFVVNTVSSLASPFYPGNAQEYGVPETVIGLILGLYHLTVFFVAPVVPLMMRKISPDNILKTGIFIAGTAAGLFGFISKVESPALFIIFSIALRLFQGLGCAFVDTSLYTIISEKYPKNLGKASGFLTTAVGLGFMVGPPVGGVLYAVGGFLLPFIVMGSCTLMLGFIMIFALPNKPVVPSNRERLFSLYAFVADDGLEHSVTGYTDSSTNWATKAKCIPYVPTVQISDTISLKTILSDPKLCIILCTTIIGSSILGFQEPNLGLFLDVMGYGPAKVGMLFLLRDALFAVGSILVGYLVDSIGPYSILASGLMLGCIGYLALGPIPPFQATLASVVIGLMITGLAGSVPWVSGLPCLLKATRHLSADKSSLNSQLCGLQNSCLYLGIFLGSLMGGSFLESLSYRYTYLIYSIIPALASIVYSLSMIFQRSRGNARFEESLIT